MHEPLGARVRLGVSGPEADLEERGASEEGAEEIEDAGEAHDGREEAYRDKRCGIQNDLAEGSRAVLVHDGKHEDSRAGVVFAVHPGDSVEVRKLPEKQNREEEPCSRIEFSGGGGPADHRRNCAGDGPDEGSPDRALFERRISQQIAQASDDAEETWKIPSGEVEIDGACGAEGEAKA